MAPESVLVVRLSALGDVLFTVPAVQSLAETYPDLSIDWLVEDRAAAVLDLVPGLNDVLIYPRRELSAGLRSPTGALRAGRALARHLRRLRQRRYDLVLDFQGNLKSAVHRRLTRGARKVGFAAGHNKERSHLWGGETVAPTPSVIHRVDKALALVRAACPEVPPEAGPPRLEIPADSVAFARRGLAERGVEPGEPYAVLHPGTSAFGAFKRWRPDRFGRLGDLLEQHLGLRALVTYGPGEEELAQRVLASMKSERGRLAPPTRSLADLAAILRGAQLFVGSDSAPLHLAAFFGTPVAALFGPKDPAVYGPRFAPQRSVRTWLPCSPCQRRTCPDALCMEEIGVGQVLEACRAVVAERISA